MRRSRRDLNVEESELPKEERREGERERILLIVPYAQ